MRFASRILKIILETFFPLDEATTILRTISPAELLREASIKEMEVKEVEAILSYKHPLAKKLIWLLKYEKNEKAAELCAALALERLIGAASEKLGNEMLPLLIPIPLSRKRLRERGFNQALLIGEKMVKMGGSNFFELRPDLLLKIKDTPSQTKSIGRESRLRNLADCFAVRDKGAISGREIIILDDVTTTGATFAEAKKTLAEAGARNIYCLAIAH